MAHMAEVVHSHNPHILHASKQSIAQNSRRMGLCCKRHSVGNPRWAMLGHVFVRLQLAFSKSQLRTQVLALYLLLYNRTSHWLLVVGALCDGSEDDDRRSRIP